MSNELKIEKERMEVHLTTIGGVALSGHVFVQPYSPLRGGRERPTDVLNSHDPYFPLETEDGFVLVAKAATAELDYQDDETPQEYGMLPLDVTLTVSGGQKYTGSIWVEGPVNTPRLLDFMNRDTKGGRFLTLYDGSRVRLINRACIETIRSER
jgi:hypothetical protein